MQVSSTVNQSQAVSVGSVALQPAPGLLASLKAKVGIAAPTEAEYYDLEAADQAELRFGMYGY